MTAVTGIAAGERDAVPVGQRETRAAHGCRPVPRVHVAAVLLGFPAVSTLISLLLLDRGSLGWTGLDFFTALWWLITAWYVAQIGLLAGVLHRSGWHWRDIGFVAGRRETVGLVGGYLVFGTGLIVLIELALRQAGANGAAAHLSDLANLSPRTLPQRVAYLFMGLAAGFCEELVYRGFALRALQRQGMPTWLAVLVAALAFVFQHGLKSVPQFDWFFGWALVLSALFLWRRTLRVNLVLHWLVILSALPAVLQGVR